MNLKKFIRVSLGLRLFLYFFVSGLLISYITFLVTVSYSTRQHIVMMSSIIVSRLKEMTLAKGGDFYAPLVGTRQDDLAQTVAVMKNLLYTKPYRIRSRMYYSGRNSREWKEIYFDANNYMRDRPLQGSVLNDLERTCRHGMGPPQPVFWGRNDRVSFFVNVTPGVTDHRYILELEANRQGVVASMYNEGVRVAGFSAFLVILSLALAKLFSRRISIPIRKLSDESQVVAAGNLSHRFVMDRNDEIGTLASSLNSMTLRIGSQMHEIENRMKTMETMNLIDKAVLSSISRNDLLDRVLGIVASLYSNSSLVIAMRDYARGGFSLLSIYRGGARGMLQDDLFIPDDSIPAEVLSRSDQLFCAALSPSSVAASSGVSFTDTRVIVEFFSPLFGFMPGSLACTPIFIHGSFLGPLIIAKEEPEGYTAHDLESIRMLADQVGVAMHSVQSFEEKEKLLLGIMLALTRSIDAKSRWTAGHSERVAALSEQIALRMLFDEKAIRVLTISAILRDIGKIAVPEQILDKPASLTPEEYGIVKKHPRVGASIISDIPSYDSIMPGILYHHEHWDGSGYPDGLKKDTIPLNSRIITVADVYDVITAERPYRRGMNQPNAEIFMKDNSGLLFDPDIASLLLKIINEKK